MHPRFMHIRQIRNNYEKYLDFVIITMYNIVCKKTLNKTKAKLAVQGIAFRNGFVVFVRTFIITLFRQLVKVLVQIQRKEVIFISDFIKLRAEAKKELVLRGWTHKDLAKATGYSVNSIDSFMCGARASDKLVKSVTEALNLERS